MSEVPTDRSFVGLALAMVAGLAVGCGSSGRAEISRDPGGADAAVDAERPDAAAEASVNDAGADLDAEAGPLDAPVAPVWAGIVAVPRGSAAEPSAADYLEAHLEVMAAGSRAAVLHAPWKELYPTSISDNPQAWGLLDTALGLYSDEPELRVLVSISVVDRTLEARPDDLTGSWGSQASRFAIETLIDRLFSSAGSELSYLAFGREIDRWLNVHSDLQRADMVAFLIHALGYARQHPAKPEGLAIGVLLSSSAILVPSDDIAELLTASDAAMLSHVPLDADFMPRAPSAVAGDLDALRVAISSDARPRLPVVLAEVGYPSSDLAAGSEAKQQQFYDGVYQALSYRRETFPFVAAFALNDAQREICEADAEAFGASGHPALLESRCSLGLRSTEAAPKPAWGSVLDALATFRAP